MMWKGSFILGRAQLIVQGLHYSIKGSINLTRAPLFRQGLN